MHTVKDRKELQKRAAKQARKRVGEQIHIHIDSRTRFAGRVQKCKVHAFNNHKNGRVRPIFEAIVASGTNRHQGKFRSRHLSTHLIKGEWMRVRSEYKKSKRKKQKDVKPGFGSLSAARAAVGSTARTADGRLHCIISVHGTRSEFAFELKPLRKRGSALVCEGEPTLYEASEIELISAPPAREQKQQRAVNISASVPALLKELREASDSVLKRRIRRRLRALGHRGGMHGAGETP